MVLSPLGRWVSMDMTTQLAMMVRMMQYSKGRLLTSHCISRRMGLVALKMNRLKIKKILRLE